VTLAVTTAGIGGASFWRDEAATLSAAHRPLPGLAGLLGRMDAVHGAYYLLMWVVVRLAGSSEAAARMPSALAMAAAAGLTAALGRRLVSARAGTLAGLVVAALPAVSWFGQDARPFAAETAAAVAASYALARVLAAPAGRPRRAWLARYAAALVLLGLSNLLGLLLVPAHGATLAAVRDGRAREQWRGWLTAVAAALAALTPLAVLAWAQRGQIGWLHRPGLAALATLGRLLGPPATWLAVATVLACGCVLSASRGRLRRDWPPRLAAFCLPWLALPPAALLTVSQFGQPVYAFRYVVFCIPALALLAGAGLAALGRAGALAGLALIAVLGLPSQLGERAPAGHGDNIRLLDQVLARERRPGDGLIYLGGPGLRTFAAAYPFGLSQLRDLTLGTSPAASKTISGRNAPAGVVRTRLTTVTRVWAVAANRPLPAPAAFRQLGFRLVRQWRISDIWLWLYARGPPRAPSAREVLPRLGEPAWRKVTQRSVPK
jgi:mannosyltransferase